jgi:carnosine N-methyltransferase
LVKNEIERLFPVCELRPSIQVLVTGAGLARLAWDLRKMGFSVTGNEFSYFMLLTSNFILNACQQVFSTFSIPLPFICKLILER